MLATLWTHGNSAIAASTMPLACRGASTHRVGAEPLGQSLGSQEYAAPLKTCSAMVTSERRAVLGLCVWGLAGEADLGLPARGSVTPGRDRGWTLEATATALCGCKQTCTPPAYSIHMCTQVRIDKAPASAQLCRRKLQSKQALFVSGRNYPVPGEDTGKQHQGQLPSTQWAYSASFPRGTCGSTCLNHCCELGSCVANAYSLHTGSRNARPRSAALAPPGPPSSTLKPYLFPGSSKGCPSVCLHPKPMRRRTPARENQGNTPMTAFLNLPKQSGSEALELGPQYQFEAQVSFLQWQKPQ